MGSQKKREFQTGFGPRCPFSRIWIEKPVELLLVHNRFQSVPTRSDFAPYLLLRQIYSRDQTLGSGMFPRVPRCSHKRTSSEKIQNSVNYQMHDKSIPSTCAFIRSHEFPWVLGVSHTIRPRFCLFCPITCLCIPLACLLYDHNILVSYLKVTCFWMFPVHPNPHQSPPPPRESRLVIAYCTLLDVRRRQVWLDH